MKRLELSLIESEVKIILEALTEEEAAMEKICENSGDEDEVEDVGNDLIELRLVLKEIKGQVARLFGDSVMEFSKNSLLLMPTPREGS